MRILSLGFLLTMMPPCPVNAQPSARPFRAHGPIAYVRAGAGGAEPYAGGASLSLGVAVIPENAVWGGAFDLRSLHFTANKTPFDIEPGSTIGMGSGNGHVPPDRVIALSLHVVREHFFRYKMFRAGLEAGPSYVVWKEVQFIPRVPPSSSGLFSIGTPRNYDYSIGREPGFGISARAKIVFAMSKALGFEVALNGNVNTSRSFYAIEGALLLGQVRDRLRPKHANNDREIAR